MNEIEKRARELLAAEFDKCGNHGAADDVRHAVPISGARIQLMALRAIIAALTPPEQFPEGWHLSERATCYVLSEGNNIVGNFVGPDAEQNAARVARMLAARPEVK